jgi:tetratricopeptide (TPR) repeat protein
MKQYMTFLLVVLVSLFSCEEDRLTTYSHPQDYNAYLQSDTFAPTSKYFELWNSKIKPDSLQLMSFGHVAGEYSRYFKATGNIEFLKSAEQALQKAVQIAAIGKADYNRALARNYIAQHRFREALQLAEMARSYGSGVKESQYLLFDVTMELGQYGKAEKYLDSVKNFTDFGYLIRLAKWNDHQGKLDTTIKFMEQAANKAENSKSVNLMVWSYTNLADYYGHARRIGDSYRYYLKSLALDPANAHAKKGIAWIVFSHEKDPQEAMRILDSVTRHYRAPDYFLLKAEIADYMQDDKARNFNLDQYFKMVKDSSYGEMYNAHNITFFLEQTIQYDRALVLAEKEVENRPTPESYDLLAYSLYKNGKLRQAENIVDEFILGKTKEPAALLHAAEIFKAGGKQDKTRKLKAELMGSLYELGPLNEERIKNL